MPEEKEVDPGQALKARSLKEFAENTTGKPTPTQEENDRAAMGEHVIDKEPDGSAEQPENSGPGGAQPKRKTSEPIHTTAGGYQTRQSTPARPPSPGRTE